MYFSKLDSLATQLQEKIEQIPFANNLKISVERATQGSVCLKMTEAPFIMNHFGYFQAGSIFTLMEIAGGISIGTALDLSKNLLVTEKADISFLGAANQIIYAEAKLTTEQLNTIEVLGKIKKTSVLIEKITVTDSFRKIISVGSCKYYLRAGIPRSIPIKKI